MRASVATERGEGRKEEAERQGRPMDSGHGDKVGIGLLCTSIALLLLGPIASVAFVAMVPPPPLPLS